MSLLQVSRWHFHRLQMSDGSLQPGTFKCVSFLSAQWSSFAPPAAWLHFTPPSAPRCLHLRPLCPSGGTWTVWPPPQGRSQQTATASVRLKEENYFRYRSSTGTKAGVKFTNGVWLYGDGLPRLQLCEAKTDRTHYDWNKNTDAETLKSFQAFIYLEIVQNKI